MTSVASDTGPFSIVPEWVIDAKLKNGKSISDRACRLYTTLGRYADDRTGTCTPARSTLAARMGCSVDSIDRAARQLQEIRALEVQHRVDESGDLTSNLWMLKRAIPSPEEVAADVRPPREGAATGGRTGAAENENHLEREDLRASASRSAFENDFDKTWKHYPRKEARKTALKAYQARRRAGDDPAEMHLAVQRYARVCQATGRTTMHGATFFGPDERWRDFLDFDAAMAREAEAGRTGSGRPEPTATNLGKQRDCPLELCDGSGFMPGDDGVVPCACRTSDGGS